MLWLPCQNGLQQRFGRHAEKELWAAVSEPGRLSNQEHTELMNKMFGVFHRQQQQEHPTRGARLAGAALF